MRWLLLGALVIAAPAWAGAIRVELVFEGEAVRVGRIERTEAPAPEWHGFARTHKSVAGGGSATFSVLTDYAGAEGIVVDWILDGKNLLQRSGKSGGTGSGQGVLSVTVSAADLRYDGDHELIALVRDSRAHRDTKSQPVEAVWSVYYGPTRRMEPQLRGLQ